MKATFFATTIFLSIVAFVKADNCTPGLDYCGSSLVAKGNYRAQLDQLYQDMLGITVFATDGDLWDGDLFSCEGGRSGVVTIIRTCPNACIDNGNGKSDTCS